MAAGWGDHAWGPDPWGGCDVILSFAPSGLIIAWEDPDLAEPTGPATCRKAERFDLCQLFPDHICDDDENPDKGGVGDHHRFIRLFEDTFFGSANQTGLLDDVASLACVLDPAEAPPRFLDALLLHLGFTLDITLSTDNKRRIIPALVNLYKEKGTNKGIEDALFLLLGIPVRILPITGAGFLGFECGEPQSTSLTAVVSASTWVQVSNPERFEIGKPLVLIDTTAPYVDFLDTEILDIQADRVFFAAQTLTGTIEAGAQVFCDRFCDQVGDPNFDLICDELGANDAVGSQDPALYGFYVDIQRTVATTTDLEDGDTEVDIDDLEFIIVGSRVRLRDQTAPTEPDVVVTVKTKVGNTITFDPVSLTETIEAGAEAINLFNSEELALIDRIVRFAKVAHTHHTLTRDEGDAEAEVG